MILLQIKRNYNFNFNTLYLEMSCFVFQCELNQTKNHIMKHRYVIFCNLHFFYSTKSTLMQEKLLNKAQDQVDKDYIL